MVNPPIDEEWDLCQFFACSSIYKTMWKISELVQKLLLTFLCIILDTIL